MSVVLADPAGFAVGWDWQCGLTVWALGGRRPESHFTRKVLGHQLPARPTSESRARRAARRWWRAPGHAQALAGAGSTPTEPSGNRGGDYFGTWDGTLAALSLQSLAQG